MDRIYFDNAATTRLDPVVLEAMMPYLTEKYGNPSSIYSYGRETRLAVEQARKTVARILNAHPAEIFFTSGGTESSNTALYGAVADLGCRILITSRIEHHATLHTVERMSSQFGIQVQYVNLKQDGHVDMDDLEELLTKCTEKCMVSLMHANNEIGNITDIEEVGRLCAKYSALFHSDTVQTLGNFQFDLRKLPVHFITGSSHKFHGPKGVGVLYINENVKIHPFIQGGSQERNMRAGTENIYGIVGFARALELAMENRTENQDHILMIRNYFKECILEKIPGVSFNGDYNGKYLPKILSVAFPKTEKSEMLLFNLDIHQICASGGSACTSGANVASHVISAISPGSDQVTVRFSFSKYNTRAEVDAVVSCLKEML